VKTESFGGVVLFRVDSPAIPEREETLITSGYSGGQLLPAGTVIRHAEIPSTTVLLGASSIFRLTPITEDLAIEQIIRGQRLPFNVLSIPTKQLAAPDEDDDEDDGGDEDRLEDESC
jgi:hypothetical protein